MSDDDVNKLLDTSEGAEALKEFIESLNLPETSGPRSAQSVELGVFLDTVHRRATRILVELPSSNMVRRKVISDIVNNPLSLDRLRDHHVAILSIESRRDELAGLIELCESLGPASGQ